jgi:hypothetical protein
MKILASVGLAFEQIDLIELDKQKGIDYQALRAAKLTQKFISFGVGLSRLGWNWVLVPYQIKAIEGIDFLLVDSLQSIAMNQNLKKGLWLSLQKIFNV